MPEEITIDGMTTELSKEAVADLLPEDKNDKPEAPKRNAEGQEAEPTKPAETPAKKEEPAEVKVEEPVREPEPAKPGKPKPIATLLAKQHELKTQLEDRDRQLADLTARVEELSKRPETATTDNKIKALAEKHGLAEDLVADLVAAARDSVSPQIPKEVKDLLAERETQKQEAAELQAFESRAAKLAKAFPNEPILEHKAKLLELAYSDKDAPDGEPYFQKELAELYFGFIKPEVEPGKVSGEKSRGGSRAGGQVIDFAEIHADSIKEIEFVKNADSETFKKYQEWLNNESEEAKRPKKYI